MTSVNCPGLYVTS